MLFANLPSAKIENPKVFLTLGLFSLGEVVVK